MPTPLKPVPPSLPTVSQVPEELRLLKRWVGWRATYDESKGKWRKPPHSPVTGEGIGATEKYLVDFLTFEEALTGVEKFKLDGVGFVFVDGDGYVGIDFDDCITEGSIHPEVITWLRWFPSYQEISPSGTGVHAIVKGKVAKALTATPLPKGGESKVEIYNRGRYFTFTGQHVGSSPFVMGDSQTGIEKLLVALGTAATAVSEKEPERAMSRLTARQIQKTNLEGLRNAQQGEGNAQLNSASFFAARAFTAGVLEQTETELKAELLNIVTKEWSSPHPEHGARETIESGWTSGLASPLVVREDEWPQVTEVLEELNKDFAVVEDLGSRCQVIWEDVNPAFTKGKNKVLGHQSFYDFKNRYINVMIEVGVKTTRNPETGAVNESPKFKDKGSVWLEHRNRRQYKQVVFAPNEKKPDNILNLWQGFAFEPKKGDCSLYLDHLRDNICQKESITYDYLIKWMAHAVRHPNEVGHVAIVIQGLKGVGKNVAAEGFANLWGPHAMMVSDQGRLTRNFNSHLRDKCVLVADEAFFAGDRRHESTLKTLITSPTITIEAKGVDVTTVPNLLHIIILGNDSWLVPAGTDERRFLALNCGSEKKEDHKYFQAIEQQLENGGYAALLHYLLHEVDMNGFNVRQAPHTDELRRQIVESLRDVEAAWYECLYNGTIPGRFQKDGTILMRTSDFLTWAGNVKGRHWSLKAQHVGHLLGDNPKGKQKGMGFDRQRNLARDDRSRYWTIPKLEEARKLWDKLRVTLPWPADDGEWDTIEDGPNS